MTVRASLLSFPELCSVAEPILRDFDEVHEETFTTGTFPNGEFTVSLDTPGEAHDVFLLATINPPAERLLLTLTLADTIRRRGARTITLIAPYLAYSRHDKGAPSVEHLFFLLGRLMNAAGIDTMLTIDIHHSVSTTEFGIPFTSLSPAALFARALNDSPFRGATLVAPDDGARPRADDLARNIGGNPPIVYGHKTRTIEGVQTELERCAAERVILVDDILDTGRTLIEAARWLRKNGAPRIAVCVSHGLFTGDTWQELWNLGVERIYTTDSVGSGVIPVDDRIEIIPIAPVIAESIADTRHER